MQPHRQDSAVIAHFSLSCSLVSHSPIPLSLLVDNLYFSSLSEPPFSLDP